jgi:hypothetical protein
LLEEIFLKQFVLLCKQASSKSTKTRSKQAAKGIKEAGRKEGDI